MDDKLRHILTDKLSDYETPVPQHLWGKVSASAPTTKVGTSLLAKWALITAAAAGFVAAALLFFKNEDNSPVTTTEEKGQTSTAETSPLIENTPSDTITAKETTPENRRVVMGKQLPGNYPLSEDSTLLTTSEVAPPLSNIQNKPKHVEVDKAYHAVTSKPDEEPVAPKSDLSFTAVPVSGRELTYFFMPANPSAKSYRWNFGDDEHSTEMTPLHTFYEPGVYDVVLEMFSEKGVEQVTNQIECMPEPLWFIPSIFTPNGDGKNDTFDILALSKYVEPLELTIFNSSGTVVFTCQDSASWDGMNLQKAELPDGNYLFKLVGKNLRHQNVEKSGFIYLQR